MRAETQCGPKLLPMATREVSLGGASPSYGVCQATEKRVRSFSFFLEQRSCHFLGLKVQAS